MDRSAELRQANRRRLMFMAGFLLLWEVVVLTELVSPRFLPRPTAVISAMVELAAMAEIRSAFVDVMTMVFLAFAMAAAAGILAGSVLGLSRWAYRVFHPIVALLFSTPKLIFIPLFLVAFGIGFTSKVAYGFTSGLFPVIITVTAGIRMVDARLLYAAQSMGATRWQVIAHVLVPGSLPAVFAAMWFGIKHSLLGVLIMELFVSQRGIGFFITRYTSSFRPDRVFALIIAISLVAVLLGMTWHRLERRMSRWQVAQA